MNCTEGSRQVQIKQEKEKHLAECVSIEYGSDTASSCCVSSQFSVLNFLFWDGKEARKTVGLRQWWSSTRIMDLSFMNYLLFILK